MGGSIVVRNSSEGILQPSVWSFSGGPFRRGIGKKGSKGQITSSSRGKGTYGKSSNMRGLA